MTPLATILLFAAGAFVFSMLSALLAATEAAYAVSSKADLEVLAGSKTRQKKSLEVIFGDVEPHLLALSFSRVFLEGIAAALMTAALILVFDSVWQIVLAAVLLVALLSFLVTVAGPKNYGQRYPGEIIRFTAGLTRFLRLVLGPVASLMFNIYERTSRNTVVSDEKLRNEQLFSMVDRAAEQDLLEEEEKGIIHSVLEFGGTIVREVMVPRTEMFTLEMEQTIAEAFEELLVSRHSRAPVISEDSDDVIGVVYLRDLAGYVHRKPEEAAAKAVTRVMKPAQFVPDLQRTDDLLRQMQKEANHLALAVDEHGGIAGLVTMEDLIEELVGDIYDEHDREEKDIIKISEGHYELNARLEVDRFAELFEEEILDEDVETVGGLFVKHLGRLAEVGDQIEIANIQLTALNVEGKRRLLRSLLAERSTSKSAHEETTGEEEE